MLQSFVRILGIGAGTPTGTVSFMEGATVLATASLNAGMATATISSLTAGTHTLMAQYSGDASFAGSSSPATVLVVNAATSGLQGSGVPVRAAEGRPLQNVVVATFTDTTGAQPVSNYQTTIDWGDGTSANAGTVTRLSLTFEVTGTHTYAAEGTYTVTVTISRTGVASLTLTTTATVGGFVTQLYHDVLGRLPDAGGLSFWVSQLHQGLLTRTQVATAFWTSVEHRGLEVDQMYAMILHRPADAAGRAGWVDALLAGMTEGAVITQFLTSAEYTASHPDNSSYIAGLYHDVLNRSGTAQEIAGWVASLADGSVSRAQVANLFLTSTEAFTDAIDQYYANFLGRSPDEAGFESWLAAAQAGQVTPTSLTAGFLASDEYFNRALDLAIQ